MGYLRTADYDAGVAMVVTDLHGAWQPYERVRDLFFNLQAQGRADRLIFCGDILHAPAYARYQDESLRILQDIMFLQEKHGLDTVLLLSGNHEVAHVYCFELQKGDHVYTAEFEWAMHEAEPDDTIRYKRAEMRAFLRGLPLYVRTRAGVTLSHAGASPVVLRENGLLDVLDFDHNALLQWAYDLINNRYDPNKMRTNPRYLALARERLAIQGADDPRLLELMVAEIVTQHEQFALIWDSLFLANEGEVGMAQYLQLVELFLAQMTTFSPYPQHILTAGHVVVQKGGFQVMGAQKLRFASYAHATPSHAGVYLLLDCEQPVKDAAALSRHLHPVF